MSPADKVAKGNTLTSDEVRTGLANIADGVAFMAKRARQAAAPEENTCEECSADAILEAVAIGDLIGESVRILLANEELRGSQC